MGIDKKFNRRISRLGIVVYEIPERVWFATKLRLYLTQYGAETNITEEGYEVHVSIDTVTNIVCHIPNRDHPTSVQTTLYGDRGPGQKRVCLHDSFAWVSAYISYMELFKGCDTALNTMDDMFFENLRLEPPPMLCDDLTRMNILDYDSPPEHWFEEREDYEQDPNHAGAKS